MVELSFMIEVQGMFEQQKVGKKIGKMEKAKILIHFSHQLY
jgi:hypothetical protein